MELVLQEKERQIERLKKQIHNQKMQLEFYIKKEINVPQVIDCAKTCLPELTDENISLVLAVNKFYKETGMKSRMMELRDRIYEITSRVNGIIRTQETALNGIILNLKQMHLNPSCIEKFLGNFDVNTNYIELFNRLVDTNACLKQLLTEFKLCCEQLVNAEEKRNEIVEQVYSLPRKERTICNYLVNVQIEKFELETILKQLTKQQPAPLNETKIIENNLKFLRSLFDSTQQGVTKMLEKVYSQATALLNISKEQRQKYKLEIRQVKEENRRLRELIRFDKGGQKCPSDVEKLHKVLIKTIDEARKIEQEKNQELEKKSKECEMLKRKLSELLVFIDKDKFDGLTSITSSSETTRYFLEPKSTEVKWPAEKSAKKCASV